MVSMARRALMGLLLLWAGIAIGVEFLATPVKFQAVGLSMPVALEVGRVTFALFARLERGLLVAALVLAFLAKPGRRFWTLLAIIAGEVIVAQGWLLPILDAAVESVLQGGVPPKTPVHLVYALLEALKCLLLVLASYA